jgi:hypothetical protein
VSSRRDRNRTAKNGGGSAGRARGGPADADGNLSAEGAPDIWIESLPATDGYGAGTCRITWGAWEGYVDLAAVRATARDLLTAAAWADTATALGRWGLKKEMVTAMLIDIQGRPGGRPETLMIGPGTERKTGAGMVVLWRGEFEDAASRAGLTPDGAREMAENWLSVALAAEQDTIFDDVLDNLAGLDADQRYRMFGYVKAIRGDPEALKKVWERAERRRARDLKNLADAAGQDAPGDPGAGPAPDDDPS